MGAPLIYPTNVSADGCIADRDGSFSWGPVDPRVFAEHTALIRSAGTLVYGRRLFECMAVWETDASLAAASPELAAFAEAWQAPAKVVYSKTLTAVPTARTRVESAWDPEALAALKAAADRPVIIGGAELAGLALQAGLLDEIWLYVLPVAVGGGRPALPPEVRVDLELIEARSVVGSVVGSGAADTSAGVVLLRYRPSGALPSTP